MTAPAATDAVKRSLGFWCMNNDCSQYIVGFLDYTSVSQIGNGFFVSVKIFVFKVTERALPGLLMLFQKKRQKILCKFTHNFTSFHAQYSTA